VVKQTTNNIWIAEESVIHTQEQAPQRRVFASKFSLGFKVTKNTPIERD
jgi:hypothetical protein